MNSFVNLNLEGGGHGAALIVAPDAIHIAGKGSKMTHFAFNGMHDGSDMLVFETVVVNLRIDSAIPSVPSGYLLPGFFRVLVLGIIDVEQEDDGRCTVELGSDGSHIGRVAATTTLGSTWIASPIMVLSTLGVSICKAEKVLLRIF